MINIREAFKEAPPRLMGKLLGVSAILSMKDRDKFIKENVKAVYIQTVNGKVRFSADLDLPIEFSEKDCEFINRKIQSVFDSKNQGQG